MAARLTISSIVGLGDDIFPPSSPILEGLKVLGDFHTNITNLKFTKKSNNSKKVLAELNKSISAGENVNSDNAQDMISSASTGAFDHFALNYFSSTLLCILRAVSQKILESCEYQKNDAKNDDEKTSVEVISKLIDELNNIELQFSFGANPGPCVRDFHSSILYCLRNILGKINIIWCDDPKSQEEVLELASGEFNAWMNSKAESASHVRAYLNFDQQIEQQGKILEEVKGVTAALSDWISPSVEIAKRKQKAWNAYRNHLSGLPDEKITMFDENFGVRKVFVQPEAIYRVAGSKHRHETNVHDVAAMLGTLLSNRTAGDDLILLCGGPGSGKSTFCRFLASELSQNNQVHPIFLRLRRMEDTKDIIPFLEGNLQREGVADKIADLSEVPNVVLILDGFDELVMANRARLREFFNALKEDLSSAPLRNAKVIVSGRDTLFPNGVGLPTGAHVVSLLPFDSERIAIWGQKWRSLHKKGKGKSFKPEEFVSGKRAARGKKVAPLEHLVSWPLTLHLVARAHTSGSIDLDAAKSDQIAKAILYRSIVADTALRQSEQSSGEGRLDAKLMREFVRAIAWEMYRQGKEALELSEGLPILKEIFTDADEAMLAELSDVTIVNQPELTKGEETGFEFVHKSFSEYFVAEKIATSLEKVSFKAQEWGVDDHTWRMSVTEATGELAEHFAVRLFTAEVQEMLEPMLGDFQAFLDEESLSTSDTVSSKLVANLDQKLERLEGLSIEFSKGNLLRVVRSKVPHSGVHASDLEAFANYAAGLFLVGGSLCKSLCECDPESVRQFKIDATGFLRLVHIIQAGEVNIDRTFASRAFYSVDVGKFDASDYFPPTQPVHLRSVKGLPDHLSRAVASLEAELSFQQIWSAVNRLPPRVISREKDRVMLDRPHEFWYRDRMEYQRREGGEYLARVLGGDVLAFERFDFRDLERNIRHLSEGILRSDDRENLRYHVERLFHELRRWMDYQVETHQMPAGMAEDLERMLYERFEPIHRRL